MTTLRYHGSRTLLFSIAFLVIAASAGCDSKQGIPTGPAHTKLLLDQPLALGNLYSSLRRGVASRRSDCRFVA